MSDPYPQRRPHQVRALTNLTTAYQRTDRAQIHWACGTGKTLVGRWLAEDLHADTTLVLVPSLALVAQALAEWQTASNWPFAAIVVCSDKTTGDAWRIDPGWWTQHGVQVTTDAAPVTRFLTGHAQLPRVVFSTYHSAPVVADATRRARARFDLVVCDEAHRLAGDPDERFRVVLDDRALPAQRRLFTTATPIYAQPDSGSLSMSDMATFGPVADRLDFADAIAAGLLVDYQVVVLDATGDADKLDHGRAVPAALAAASREGLGRVITFHSRVHRARLFATAADGLRLPDGRTVRARAIAGTDPTARRRASLAELADGAPDTLTLVANARCLTEGVNVPAVDGVVFADPKTSDTDIVQAIGRALRPAPGKTRGLVILPVVMPDGADTDELFAGPFAAVWGVLRALRSLDARMAAELDRLRTWRPGRDHDWDNKGGGYVDGLLRFDLDGVDLSTLAARVINPGAYSAHDDSWTDMLDMLRGWVKRHGHTAVTIGAVVDGKFLGRWVYNQRHAYALNALSADRVARLEGVPGWAWTTDGAYWASDHTVVADTAARFGGLDLTNPDLATAKLAYQGRAGRTIGRWCAQQRRAYRDGDLDDRHAALCETIPGWTWNAGVPDHEQRLVDALAEWVEKHGDANVPHDATWGSLPLGRFITAVRRRAVTDRLALPLAEDIAVVTPTKGTPGALEWRATETRWELCLMALRQFAARTGGCDIPEHGTETLGGYDFRIYDWATRQRYLYRRGELEADRAKLLEQVPGWAWERERKTRVVVGIGARQHGTRLGYAAGCRCEDCTAANTGYEVDRQRRQRAGEATTRLVDASAARGHLRILEAQIGKRARPAMRDVTGLNKKTIDEVINGTRARIQPEVDAALRGLTVERLRAHIEANPSPRDDIPAGPTLALVDDLVARGWPKAWISRELGGDGRALQIGRSESGLVYREKAEAIAALHAAIGDRVPPPRAHSRAHLPRLAEILAAEQADDMQEAA